MHIVIAVLRVLEDLCTTPGVGARGKKGSKFMSASCGHAWYQVQPHPRVLAISWVKAALVLGKALEYVRCVIIFFSTRLRAQSPQTTWTPPESRILSQQTIHDFKTCEHSAFLRGAGAGTARRTGEKTRLNPMGTMKRTIQIQRRGCCTSQSS
ncbi:hypothetical protein BDN72DRAFT_838464 [Pluteus cervinus]|uniref:Uncharacterized protein n=1 Tax=Pluteus cervinus TaxID=181527 RepID=A0ACD3AZL0_9AGAR|nr:hypothetical protein BDN72DRAFT_838464 [Pluteus cervinus]